MRGRVGEVVDNMVSGICSGAVNGGREWSQWEASDRPRARGPDEGLLCHCVEWERGSDNELEIAAERRDAGPSDNGWCTERSYVDCG